MIPHWQADDLDIRLYHGDCRHVLACLAIMAPESISCCITSPPYYGLRDYGLEPVLWGSKPGCQHEWSGNKIRKRSPQRDSRGGGIGNGDTRGTQSYAAAVGTDLNTGNTCRRCGAWCGCLGLEPTPDCGRRHLFEPGGCGACYVCHLTEVFAQVRRVLHPLGTLWLNLGDSYAGGAGGRGDVGNVICGTKTRTTPVGNGRIPRKITDGPKPKNLLGIPWLVAFALRAAGWHLRSDIVWAKTNAMPESVYDRPTKSHEYVFLFSKQQRYYYDNEAVAEPAAQPNGRAKLTGSQVKREILGQNLAASTLGTNQGPDTRNLRSVWQFATQSYHGAHFATFPEELARRCVLAGCPPGGIVLDPFCGTGTTGAVCVSLERRFVGIDASATYLDDHAAARIGAALVARGYT